jgi:ATP/ADP translocase
MGRLLGSIFGLRPDERTVAFLMAGYHFLLLVSLYLLKPVRDSIFLSSRGPEELPFVFLLTTAVVTPVAFLHTRAARRVNVGPLIDGVSLVLVGSIVGLRLLLGVGGEWVAYLLYASVSIYGLLVTAQFWLMANALFTASQSKRVFTLLSAGAILGAIAGGEVTGLLVENLGLGSENLLWGAAGVLLAATGLGTWIRRERREPAARTDAAGPDEPEATGALSIIRDSRHIQLIVGILTLMVVVSTLVDYQFKTVAARAYPTEEGLTTFMGQFYGRVSIVALLVQFVLAPRLMRVVGIGGALSALPGVLAVGTVGMLAVPGLVAGVFLRGAGQSLKHSLDKTGRELLFVPVSLEKKKRVKVFVDLFVDQGAQGLGGLLLLGLAYGAGLSVQMISLVTLLLIAAWGALTYGVRQTYVDQFRAKLREREREAERAEDGPAEERPPSAELDELLDALCSRAETDVLHALEELEGRDDIVPVEALLCLLDHPSAAVRAQTIRVLRVREVEDVGEPVAEALRDPDPDVQLEAARYLYCQLTDNHLERLERALQHDDPQIRAAAVGLIAEEGTVEEYRLVSESLIRRLVRTEGQRGHEARTQVARILGVLDRPYRNELLHRLLRDETPSVVRAAIRAAGKTGDPSFVHVLVRRLADDAHEAEAQRALEAFGGEVFGTLYDHLTDEALPMAARRRLPPVFAAHPSRFGLVLLVRSLRRVPVPVRHAVVRALSRIHAADDFSFDPDPIDTAIEQDLRHYAALGQILRLCRLGKTGASPLPAAPIQTLREEALERVFRLLGLRYDQRDIYDAYLGITSADPSLRDSAVEFVDNLVDYTTRRVLLPLLDDPEGEQALTIGQQYFDLHLRGPHAARRYLENVDDPRIEALLTEDGAAPEAGEGARTGPVAVPFPEGEE